SPAPVEPGSRRRVHIVVYYSRFSCEIGALLSNVLAGTQGLAPVTLVHHPIFERFTRTPQRTDALFEENFIGAKTRNEYEAEIRRHKTKSGLAMRFTAVEADPGRFRWLVQNFKDNGLDGAAHRLIWGAVADSDEPVMFPIHNARWTGNQAHNYGSRIKQPTG